jgi:hypothetical protein
MRDDVAISVANYVKLVLWPKYLAICPVGHESFSRKMRNLEIWG